MWPLEQDRIMEQDRNHLEEAEETREQKSCLGGGAWPRSRLSGKVDNR